MNPKALALLEQLQLPIRLPESGAYSTEAIIGRMKLDKKTVAGQLRFVLPTRIGSVQTFRDIPETLVRSLCDEQLA